MGSDRHRRRLHHGSLDDDAGGGIPPQSNEELARQGDNDRLAHPPANAPDPLVEPQAEYRARPGVPPEPGQLDHWCSQPGVARLGYTLLVIDRAALPWRRRQTGVGGDLPAVIEPAEQALRPEDGGSLGADALQP